MTLRMQTLNTERLPKYQPGIIRWMDRDELKQRIHFLLDNLTNEDAKLARLQTLWTTLNWICARTGYDQPEDCADLQAAYEHATTQLTPTLYKKQSRSVMLTDECVQVLEGCR